MVNQTLLLTAALATTAYAFTWTKCTNVPRCVQVGQPGPYSGAGFTGFTYNGDTHYWYSHQVDGLYVSPEGYFNPAHDSDIVDVYSNDNKIGITHWQSGGNACCLPDEVGTNIANVEARST
ncbi:hypothetical protein ColLi_07155 [Colletotrichum liriopes]|uniref:Uncharacterized protein n=1 Tax=Colletotrichum liriopes TaxID=708192 RepID=A0AA37GPQ7_9PEZI|nr:hypothetical protein ColLi_07155 [Colletotrichum liriopes]